MRLHPEIAKYLKQIIEEKIPNAKIYLFGSRTDDNERGGDIDIMILTEVLAEKRILRKIRLEFIKKFGWRKIDLVNFSYSDESAFRKLIEINSVPL